MKNVVFFLAFLLLISLFGCNRSKRSHNFTFKIKKGLYVEVYNVGLLGDLKSKYLTDSTTFRKYIGTFDDQRIGYSFDFTGDSIYVRKLNTEFGNEKKVVEVRVFNINELRKKRHFE